MTNGITPGILLGEKGTDRRSGSDRRRLDRCPIQGTVLLQGRTVGYIVDISIVGLSLQTDSDFAIGMSVTVVVCLDGCEPFSIQSSVRSCVCVDGQTSHRIGIQYSSQIPDNAYWKILDHVARSVNERPGPGVEGASPDRRGRR